MGRHIVKVRNRKIYVSDPQIPSVVTDAETILLDLDSEWDNLEIVFRIGDFAKIWDGSEISLAGTGPFQNDFVPISVLGFKDGTFKIGTEAKPKAFKVFQVEGGVQHG